MTFLIMALLAVQAQPVVEPLGEPCKAWQVLAGRAITDCETGRECLVVTTANEASHMALVFIDFHMNTSRLYTAPAGSGSWALNEAPGGRLIVGTYYDGQFMAFDLKTMRFITTVGFPGEEYIWNLAMGKDGRFYGGTYDGAKLGAFDLNTYTVEDCGAPVPPNLYLRNVSALPDGRILCSFGMEKPATLVYDPSTKAFSPPPPALENTSAGVTWKDYFVAGSMVLKGDTLEAITPPFPTPPPEKGAWSVDDYVTTKEVLVFHQGNAVYRYAAGEDKPTLLCDLELRGGRILALSKKNEVLGVRGQDYFCIAPGETSLNLKRIPGDPAPRPSLFLRMDEQGLLWGGPHFGQTLFSFEPKTRTEKNTGAVCDSGGEVYDVAFLNGKVYAVAYAGGDIIEYDPSAPWDQWNRKNPRSIAQLSSKGYIRPAGGIVAGADGKLYSGWMAKYGTYGGAIAITDPASGETVLVENPAGQQAIIGVCVDNDTIYFGTSLQGNGLPEKKGEHPKFGVLLKEDHSIQFQEEFERVSAVHRFALDAATQRVVFTAGSALRVYDIREKRVLPQPDTPPPPVTSHQIVGIGDGRVYYGNAKKLVCLDLDKGIILSVAELPEIITNAAMKDSRTFFLSCEARLYQVAL